MCKANRKKWTHNQMSAQLRRLLSLKFTGAAWDLMHTPDYEKGHRHAWLATGSLMTADGSEDHLIKPEGLMDYVAPAAGQAVPPEWLA